MNVYDFDNTIYDGESVIDFYLFALKKCPRLISVLPKLIQMLIRYKACRVSVEELLSVAEKYVAKALVRIDFEELVSEFWNKNQNKIKDFYLKQKAADDVVLSASWSFLIEEMCQRLGVKTVIASEIDMKTGKISQLCFREKKVQLFKDMFPDTIIENFYTDSMNDAPMFPLAERVYLVKGNKIKEISHEI